MAPKLWVETERVYLAGYLGDRYLAPVMLSVPVEALTEVLRESGWYRKRPLPLLSGQGFITFGQY